MVRLDERMRIGSRTRDRIGMLCATAAVACLASFMLQWSRELPVQQSPWEQDLFGDLAGPVSPLTPQRPHESSSASHEPSAAQDAQGDHQRDKPILVDVLPNPMGHTPAAPLDRQPTDSRPRFIQTVRHQQPHDPPTVWLSGAIELLGDDPEPESQPGTRYFPDAHLD